MLGRTIGVFYFGSLRILFVEEAKMGDLWEEKRREEFWVLGAFVGGVHSCSGRGVSLA